MKFRKDVEDTFRQPGNRGIKFDIVGFNLTPKDQDERRSLQDLKEVTAEAGGAFYSVQDPTNLLRALEESLGLSK